MNKHREFTIAALLVCAAIPLSAFAAPAPRGDGGGQAQPAEPEISRLIPRGDLEILTFETEEDYNKLQQLYEENREKKPEPGTQTIQYFRSKMDGSVQPYSLWIPSSYTGEKPFTMVVALHGISPHTVRGNRVVWNPLERDQWINDYTPAIFVQPLGRTNNFYTVMGEQDVLEVMEQVQSRFNIDPGRIFLEGHSMGGGGAKTLGLHYPDRFGSIVPIDAAGGRGAREESPDTPGWLVPQLDLFDLGKLYFNAFNLNIYIKDAGSGIGGGKDNGELDSLLAAGANATREAFARMPHHFAMYRSYGMFIDEAIQQPIPRDPPQVNYHTNNLRYNRAYWITIDQLIQHNAGATVEAVYGEGRPKELIGPGALARMTPSTEAPPPPALKVQTKNIAGLTLRLAGTVAPKDAEMPIIIDGQTVLEGKTPEVMSLANENGTWKVVDQPALAGKRHGLQGPIWDVFTVPFLGVYGDGPGAKELAVAELEQVISQGTFHGDFPLKSASKLTDEDVKNHSLILFGGPEANSVVARIADRLPRPLMDGPHDGANGVVMILPNPENPERYAVVWTAKLLSADENPLPEGIRGRRNLTALPDYLVVRSGKIERAGHFDNNWKLSESGE